MRDKDTTICVHDFMIKSLRLNGAELLTYALIYQYTIVKPYKMVCSLKYLADRVGVAERNIKGVVNKLIDKGLIDRQIQEGYGINITIYKVINEKKFPQNGQNILQEDISAIKKQDERKVPKERRIKKERENICVDSCSLLSKEDKLYSLDNQDIESDTIKQDNKEDSTTDIPKNKTIYFIPPTVEQVEEYCETRNNGISAQEFVDFYSSKGWMIGKNKMKDWKAAVRTWESKRKREIAEKTKPEENTPTDLDYIFG